MSGTYIQIPVEGGGGSSFITSIADTDSIDLTEVLGLLTADARISSDAATSGFFKATTTIKSGAGAGLHVEAQIANGSQTGFISNGDWTTFNAKEPAIVPGTVSQYWRGDKSFQTLNMAALLAVTSGAAAGVGTVGQVVTASQASNTSTGVGATGAYGSVTSVILTAGAWYVTGVAGFSENGATLTTGLQVGISASSSGSGISEFDTQLTPALISSTSDTLLAAPGVFVDISSTTTYYLNTRFWYTAGSPQHRGQIKAWRIR